jgi:hypothetical protein
MSGHIEENMTPFKDEKFDKTKSKKMSNPLAPQPSFDSRKRMFDGGDYYGTGYRAKIGKMRSDSVGMDPIPRKSLRTDPRSLA